MRKSVLPYANNKGADEPAPPRSQFSAFVIRYLDSIIPLDSISEISGLWLVSVTEQDRLCITWSQTPKTIFLVTRLICSPATLRHFFGKHASMRHRFTFNARFFWIPNNLFFDIKNNYLCSKLFWISKNRFWYIQNVSQNRIMDVRKSFYVYDIQNSVW